MFESISPDGKYVATYRSGGEMWMSGPEWGYLSIDNNEEIKGATQDILWSSDCQYIVFVKLVIDEVPNGRGTEGMSFRVAVVRLSDFKIRYCLGNNKLAELKLKSCCLDEISVLVNGQSKLIKLASIYWN
ncbi:hypothetical protein D3O61_21995 [Vibrio vulnificus]|nr:hypothetical protein [Vibrio vulnificus]